MRFIGLDIGTTTIACAVIDALAGTIVSTASRPHHADIAPLRPDEHLQDPHLLLAKARAMMEEALSSVGPVHGIGVTGQMHGILYTDESGRAVSPFYTWMDGRAERQVRGQTYSYVSALKALVGEHTPSGFGAATHYTNLSQQAVPAEARFVCGIVDYIAMHLTNGNSPVTDPSLAHGLGLYDYDSGRLNQDKWISLGEPVLKLPRVAGFGHVLGTYENGIPVAVPIGDNQASFLGSVKDPSNTLLVNVGTAGQISCSEDVFGGHLPSSLERRPYPGDGSIFVGATLAAGKALEVLARFVSEVDTALQAGRSRDPYELLQYEPETLSGPLLKVDTRFAGSRREPYATGAITNITLHNFTLGHLVHGFLQGIVDELHDLWVEAACAEGREDPQFDVQYVVGSGNTIRNNPLLQGLLSRTFGRPLLIPAHRETAAVGAAIYALASVTQSQPSRASPDIIKYEATVEPTSSA